MGSNAPAAGVGNYPNGVRYDGFTTEALAKAELDQRKPSVPWGQEEFGVPEQERLSVELTFRPKALVLSKMWWGVARLAAESPSGSVWSWAAIDPRSCFIMSEFMTFLFFTPAMDIIIY